MYDTVRLFFPCNGVPLYRTFGDFVEVTACDPYGKGFITGRLQNLKVTLSPRGMRLAGSLCKLHLGNNFHSLDRATTQEAIESLSEYFSLNLKESKVERLDIGVNLQMQYEPTAYFDYIGGKPRYKKNIYPTGILYQTKSQEISFYDKMREATDKGGGIPEEYVGNNLLRCEARMMKTGAVKKVLNVKELNACGLWDVDIWNKCANYLQKQYDSIEKYGLNNELSEFDFMEMNDFYNATIIAYAEQQGGMNVVLSAIKRAQQQGKFDKCKAKRFRDRVKKAVEAAGKTAKKERACIVQELTEKVTEAVEECKV